MTLPRPRSPSSRRGPRRVACTLLVAALALAGVRLARAQDTSDRAKAKGLLGEGLRLMEAHDYQAALDRFQAAFQLVPSPKIFFNLGEAQFGLGHDAEAFVAFESFLERAPDAPAASRATATKRRATLRARLGFIDAATDPNGATLLVDGREVGPTPLERAIAVVPGQHQIDLKKSGLAPESRLVSVEAGQTIRVMLSLQPLPAAHALTRKARTVGHEGAPAGDADERVRGEVAAATGIASARDEGPPLPAGRGPAWVKPTAWVAGAVAVAAIGVGLSFQLLSASKNREFNNVMNAPDTPDMKCDDHASAPTFGGGSCPQLRADADQDHRLALIAFAAGGVLAVGSAVMFIVSPQSAGTPNRQAFACQPVSSRAELGARCSLTF